MTETEHNEIEQQLIQNCIEYAETLRGVNDLEEMHLKAVINNDGITAYVTSLAINEVDLE